MKRYSIVYLVFDLSILQGSFPYLNINFKDYSYC